MPSTLASTSTSTSSILLEVDDMHLRQPMIEWEEMCTLAMRHCDQHFLSPCTHAMHNEVLWKAIQPMVQF